MTIFFTSDTHFGHANIIKYCKRPFSDTKEMDETIITNWNSKVRQGDTVYHLGDFGWVKDKQHFLSYYRRLNGRIFFLKGNHDKVTWNQCRSLFQAAYEFLEMKTEGQDITLCHYAMRVWNKSHHGAWHLYGHSHGSLPDDPNSLSFDIGVDCHNFYPVSFEEVGSIMKKKLFKPIDHHGEGGNSGEA